MVKRAASAVLRSVTLSIGYVRSHPWLQIILVVAIPVAVVTSVMISVLLTVASGGPADQQASLRIDAIRTALTIGAGTGGLIGLVLAGRRQWSTERAADDTRHDAEQKRITELYGRAADQLGHEKVAVRLAGVYALERLASDSPQLRQVIVNLLCGYLANSDEGGIDGASPVDTPVRRAISAIFASHLYPEADRGFSPDIDLDFSNGRLDNLRLGRCSVRNLVLDKAVIAGDLILPWIKISEHLGLKEVHVGGSVVLAEARIWALNLSFAHVEGEVRLSGAVIERQLLVVEARVDGELNANSLIVQSDSDWRSSKFGGEVRLKGVQFGGKTGFRDTVFDKNTAFTGSVFVGPFSLSRASFRSQVEFSHATFRADAKIEGVSFRNHATFKRVRFGLVASFSGSLFSMPCQFSGSKFAEGATFSKARGEGSLNFRDCRFAGPLSLTKARLRGNIHFRGTELIAGVNADRAILGFVEFESLELAEELKLSNLIIERGLKFSNLRGAGLTLASATVHWVLAFYGSYPSSIEFDQVTFVNDGSFSEVELPSGWTFEQGESGQKVVRRL